MWLVVGGPILVVLAGLFTAYLATHGADRLVAPDHVRRGVQADRTLEPALKARNAAATDAARAAASPARSAPARALDAAAGPVAGSPAQAGR